jgi:hypothetical protein
MHSVAVPMEAESVAGSRQKVRRKVLDGRTRAAKRAAELTLAFEAELGGADKLSSHQRVAVQRAAQLVAIAEVAATAQLAGEGDLDQVIRAQNAARRAVNDLGIKINATKPGRTLAELAAQRKAEKAAAAIAEAAG